MKLCPSFASRRLSLLQATKLSASFGLTCCNLPMFSCNVIAANTVSRLKAANCAESNVSKSSGGNAFARSSQGALALGAKQDHSSGAEE